VTNCGGKLHPRAAAEKGARTMKVLKSYHPYEIRYSGAAVAGSRERPFVVLPAARYTPQKHARGKVNVCELSDDQIAILELSPIFRNLLKKGKGGGYVFIDKLPEHARPMTERLAREKARADRAESELAALRGKGGQGIKPIGPTMEQRADLQGGTR